jgi:hypothetical protein
MRRITIALVMLSLAGCTAPEATTSSPTPSEAPASPVASGARPAVTGAFPALDPPSATLSLPDEFAPDVSYVSPDGRFVAARARDWGRVVLYRISRPSPRASLLDLVPVAEVRGYAEAVSWLEDSSAVLVATDLDPTRTLQNHDPSGAGQRVAILNTDGRVVVAPAAARHTLYQRAHASPDGRWIPVMDRCCVQQQLLLARDGQAVRTVATARTGAYVGFAGWDKDGLLLYWESADDRSTLIAVDVDGVVRYRVSAPESFGGAGWGVIAAAHDRSWQLIEFGKGIGSSFHELRLLVGSELRELPAHFGDGPYGPFAFGDELVYGDRDGALRAYDPTTRRVRELALRLDTTVGPTSIGISGRYFVWMELIRGYVADVETGRKATLPLQPTLNVSIVDGARLAEYHFNDQAIVIFDLAAIVKQ